MNLQKVDELSYKRCVQIFLQFPLSSLSNDKKVDAIFDLQDILMDVVDAKKIGDFDGNEFCEDTVTFFIYGPDIDKIVSTLLPIIKKIPYMKGSYILKQYDYNHEEYIFLT